ncbi:MAG TPA: ankyrin repeat domain-containing protein [Rhodocyclaceae bacterium]|nr:ankyrin repeat domain-containing protein [Rhodocyclaceae bacterium]
MIRLRPTFVVIAAACVIAAAGHSFAGAYDDLLGAIDNNDSSLVAQLLVRGMDVDTVDREGNTLLMRAAREGHNHILELLLRNKANVLKINKYGDSALLLAAFNGRAQAVEKLVAAGAAINPKGWTPLIYAAFGGYTTIARLLLEKGADVDAAAPNGVTALMAAARNGHLKTVQLLLDHGARLDLRNQDGATASDWAAAAGNSDIADLLKQRARTAKP